jgi:hypothetical protein
MATPIEKSFQSPTSVTQIHYLSISQETNLTDSGSEWSKALDLLEEHGGFRRMYWGRSPEDETKVQLHIGERRRTLDLLI